MGEVLWRYTPTFPPSNALVTMITLIDIPLLIEIFLFGTYFLLFSLCIYVLLGRKTSGYRWHIASMTALFLSSAAHVVLEALTYALEDQKEWTLSYLLSMVAFATSYIIADTVFFFRCYIIWSYNKKVMILPGLVGLCTIGIGIAGIFQLARNHNDTAITVVSVTAVGLSVLNNIILTTMSATRIWWISRQVRDSKMQLPPKYKTAIVIILESGAINVVFSIIWAIFSWFTAMGFFYATAINSQSLGIVPTLIIVRVGLGISTDSVEKSMSNIAFAEQQNVTVAPHSMRSLELDP